MWLRSSMVHLRSVELALQDRVQVRLLGAAGLGLDDGGGEFAQWIGEKVIAELAGLEVEPERAGWTDEELAAIALSSQNDEEFGIIEIPPNGKSKAKIAMDSLSLGNHESWNVNVVIGEIRTVLHQNDYQRLFVWLESNYTRTGKSYANLLAELIRRAAT